MTPADIPTPFFVVNRATVRRNCERMLEKAGRTGAVLRPHVKTHKTVEGARLQLGAPTGPITVSTLAEAEFFAANGFEDITYAVPIAPSKLERAAALSRRIRHFNLLLDSLEAVDIVERFAGSAGIGLGVFLKVDCGYHRAGVRPDDPIAVELGRKLTDSPHVRFNGLLTHAGHAYHARSQDEVLPIAEAEVAAVKNLAGILEGEGIADLVLSVGSTPTMSAVEKTEADEMRPGNYIFFDRFQASIGSCSIEDCAVFVVASVVGSYTDRNEVIIDCGSIGMSKDAGATHVVPDGGYGLVRDDDGLPLDCVLDDLSQEHGIVRFSKGSALPGIGDRLRIVPNHSCLTAAQFDRFVVVEDGRVVDEWRPAKGW